LNISTKIQKGQIEIVKEFKVCEKGKKIGNSEAAILQKLNIKPFAFGMEILFVYDDGAILTPDIFNIDPEALLAKIRGAANALAAISLATGQPNFVSVPHMFKTGFKNLASIALEAGIKIKALENMSSSAPAAATGGKAAAPTQAKQEAAKPVVEEKEEEVDMGGMFDDDY